MASVHETLTFGSLFTGIGGMDLGLERAGIQCRWQCESDPYCRRVLLKHWPHVPKFSSVQAVGKTSETVDIVGGGFPCQDVSQVKQNAKGLNGDRSGLWYEFARCISVLQPRYVVIENVPALQYRGLDTILRELADLGYDAEWDNIPAYPFGAPQLRYRLFILAYANGNRLEKPGDIDSETRHVIQCGGDDTGLDQMRLLRGLPLHDSRDSRVRMRMSPGRGMVCESLRKGTAWEAESPVCRVAHGIPHRMDRLQGLGNAIVPQVAEFIGRRIMEYHNGQRA